MGSVIYTNPNNQAGFSTANVRYFGAFGNNDQTLYPTSYISDSLQTQQTADGLAINRAIVYLRSIGGGTLYIPKGVYRIWGYLESFDFNIRVVGDGVGVTVLKSCDTSLTTTNGYGILRAGPPDVLVASTSINNVTIENLTLDGNGAVRAAPALEYRSANLAIYGAPKVILTNVESKNSVLDNLLVDYEQPNDPGVGVHVTSSSCGLQAANCRFIDAFRNSISLTSGWNQEYVNCWVSGGGKIHSGINPRAGLDVEPNLATLTIQHLHFVNCHFTDCINMLVSCVWAGDLEFNGCTFNPVLAGLGGDLWPFIGNDSQVLITGCTFIETAQRIAYLRWNTPYVTGDFAQTQHLTVSDCFFDGVGLWDVGRSCTLQDCVFQNCKFPVMTESQVAGVKKQFTAKNITCINVVDANNASGGANGGFVVKQSVTCDIDIDGITCTFNPSALPSISLLGTSTLYWGITIAPTPAANAAAKISNVQSTGWYQKFPVAYSLGLDPNKYRDWGLNVTAPADTAGNTTTPGAIFYRNCTMYGNSP